MNEISLNPLAISSYLLVSQCPLPDKKSWIFSLFVDDSKLLYSFSIAFITNHHRFCNLQACLFVISQSVVQMTGMAQLGSLLKVSQSPNPGVGQANFGEEFRGKELIALWLQDWGPWLLTGHRLGSTLLPETARPHMTPPSSKQKEQACPSHTSTLLISAFVF